MHQNILLSKNHLKKVKVQAIKQSPKAQKKQENSSSESQDKIMTGILQLEQDIIDFLTEIKKIEDFKKIIKQQEEIIFNQSCQIRKIKTNINQNNNEMDILKMHLIENKLVIHEQLWQQSQQQQKRNSMRENEKTLTEVQKEQKSEPQSGNPKLEERFQKQKKLFATSRLTTSIVERC